MSQSSWLDLKRLELVLFVFFVSTKTKQTRKEDTRSYFSLYFVLVISHQSILVDKINKNLKLGKSKNKIARKGKVAKKLVKNSSKTAGKKSGVY